MEPNKSKNRSSNKPIRLKKQNYKNKKQQNNNMNKKLTAKDYSRLLEQNGYVDHTTGKTVDVMPKGKQVYRKKPLNSNNFWGF